MQDKLVPDWKDSWRWWSMRLNVAASGLIAYFVASPDTLVGIFGALPDPLRIPFAIVVGCATFALVAIARLTKQSTSDG